MRKDGNRCTKFCLSNLKIYKWTSKMNISAPWTALKTCVLSLTGKKKKSFGKKLFFCWHFWSLCYQYQFPLQFCRFKMRHIAWVGSFPLIVFHKFSGVLQLCTGFCASFRISLSSIKSTNEMLAIMKDQRLLRLKFSELSESLNRRLFASASFKWSKFAFFRARVNLALQIRRPKRCSSGSHRGGVKTQFIKVVTKQAKTLFSV